MSNTKAWTATAAARVTMASWTPRKRRAATPMRIPMAAANKAEMSRAQGNPRFQFTVAFDSRKPDAPAKAIWASETWPRYPVMMV